MERIYFEEEEEKLAKLVEIIEPFIEIRVKIKE